LNVLFQFLQYLFWIEGGLEDCGKGVAQIFQAVAYDINRIVDILCLFLDRAMLGGSSNFSNSHFLVKFSLSLFVINISDKPLLDLLLIWSTVLLF